MQLNLKTLLPIQLRDKRSLVRVFLVLSLISLCFTISLPVLYLAIDASAETPVANPTLTISSIPLPTTSAFSPIPSTTIPPSSATVSAPPSPPNEQASSNDLESLAASSESTKYPAWYSYLITTSSIMNTIIASVYAYGISASTKTQRGILYSELLHSVFTHPLLLIFLRIGSFIFAIMLVVCARLHFETAMYIFWIGSILITIMLMVLQFILETAGKSNRYLSKVFDGKLDKDFVQAYNEYVFNADSNQKAQFYSDIQADEVDFPIKATALVGRTWCSAHVIRVTNLGLTSVPQSIHNTPDTQFLLDQIQYGFAKMIDFGFFRVHDKGDSIGIHSKATWFMEQYIEMVYTILHRAYVCDMGGKHYHFAYAIQDNLQSKQAAIELELCNTKAENAPDSNSEKPDESSTQSEEHADSTEENSGSAGANHLGVTSNIAENVISPEKRELLSFFLTLYYVQAFLLLQCGSDLQSVRNGYVEPTNRLRQKLNELYKVDSLDKHFYDYHNFLRNMADHAVSKKCKLAELDFTFMSIDQWFRTALSCHVSMR